MVGGREAIKGRLQAGERRIAVGSQGQILLRTLVSFGREESVSSLTPEEQCLAMRVPIVL